MQKVRIGVIGGGGITGAHLPTLSQMTERVELVALADINETTARATAAQYGVSRHEVDYRRLLPEVDAVLVCVPTSLHSEISVAALEMGKHVFCEKPLARTVAAGEAMLAAAERSGAVLQVGHVRRFDEEWLAWSKLVQSNAIGRPVVWRDVSSRSDLPARWYNLDDVGGGPFLDGCVHNYDFALMTFGPAEWVFCHGRTMDPINTAIDSGTVTVHFASGDELVLVWSWGIKKGTSGGRLFELLGPDGVITWPESSAIAAEGHHFMVNNGERCDNIAFPGDSLATAFRLQMEEFINSVQGRAKPRAGGREGMAAVRLALAALESAGTGQRVDL